MKPFKMKKEESKIKNEVTSDSGFVTRIQPISFIGEGETSLVYSDTPSVSGFAVDFASEMNLRVGNRRNMDESCQSLTDRFTRTSTVNAISNHILSEALSNFFNIINYVIEDSSLVITSKEVSGHLFHQIKQTTSKVFYDEQFRSTICGMVSGILYRYRYCDPNNLIDYIGANASQIVSYLITETCKGIEMAIVNFAVVYDRSSSSMLQGFLQDKTFMKFYKNEFNETNFIAAFCQYVRMSLYFVMDNYVASTYLLICNRAISHMIMGMNIYTFTDDDE